MEQNIQNISHTILLYMLCDKTDEKNFFNV